MGKRQMGKRIYREPTAEQAAKYRKIRALIAEEWPEIQAEGLRLRDAQQATLTDVVSLLKTEREMQGLSLTDMGKKTGLSKSALSRLENHTEVNPTISTLMRYAKALGKQLSVVLTDAPS